MNQGNNSLCMHIANFDIKYGRDIGAFYNMYQYNIRLGMCVCIKLLVTCFIVYTFNYMTDKAKECKQWQLYKQSSGQSLR